MFYAVPLFLLIGVSAEYVRNENPAASSGEHGSQTDSNLIGKGGYPPNTRSQSNSGSGYERIPEYRAHGDYLIPPMMFPYQQRTRTPITSPEAKERRERRNQYDGQDIPNPNYGRQYLRDVYPPRPSNAYSTHGKLQNRPPLRTVNYPPFYSNDPSRKDRNPEQYPQSPVYPQYPRYNQRSEPAHGGQPSGPDDRFRNHLARGHASGERPGPAGSDNRYPPGDSIENGGRLGTQKVEDNTDFNSLLRKNGLLSQNSNKLDMKYLESLLGKNKAFDGKVFRQSEFDLGALYSKDSNSAPRADLSKLFPRDGRYTYVRNDGNQRGDRPGRYPQSPRQPAYYPSKPSQPAYYPNKPRQPVYYPSKPRQPAYYPNKPRQPAYFPSKPRQPVYYPSKPRQPEYYTRNPFASSHPGNGSPRRPPYYFESKRPTLYPQQPINTDQPRQSPPGEETNVPTAIQNGIPLTSDEIRELFGQGAGKASGQDGGSQQGQEGGRRTPGQVEQLFGQLPGGGSSKQPQEGGQQGNGDQSLTPTGGSSGKGQTGSGSFDVQLSSGGQKGGIRVLTAEEVQRLFGKPAQNPRRGNSPSGPHYQGEGGRLPTSPNGASRGNQNQIYGGGRDDQYQQYSGGRNINFQPARGGGGGQYQPPREGNNDHYEPVRGRSDNQYQPVRDEINIPYQPARGSGNNQYQPVRHSGDNQYQPIRDGRDQYQPTRGGNYNQYQPARGVSDNQYQPARDGNYNQYQPVAGGSYNRYQPIIGGQAQPAGDYGRSNDAGGRQTQYNPYRPRTRVQTN